MQHAAERPKDWANYGVDESKRIFLITMLSGAAQFALGSLLREQKMEKAPPPKTFDELMYKIQRNCGISHFHQYKARPSPEKDTPEENDPGLAPWVMSSAGLIKLYEKAKEAMTDPTQATQQAKQTFTASRKYLTNFRMSPKVFATACPAEIDCNDPSNVKCDVLSGAGVPMHFLAGWPRDPAARWDESWHLMATCKMKDKEFLILDNHQTVTHWQGTLSQFTREYHEYNEKFVPLALIPIVGISRYVRPLFDKTLAKLIQQGHHGVEEENMEQLGITPPRKQYPMA